MQSGKLHNQFYGLREEFTPEELLLYQQYTKDIILDEKPRRTVNGITYCAVHFIVPTAANSYMQYTDIICTAQWDDERGSWIWNGYGYTIQGISLEDFHEKLCYWMAVTFPRYRRQREEEAAKERAQRRDTELTREGFLNVSQSVGQQDVNSVRSTSQNRALRKKFSQRLRDLFRA